MDARIFYKKVLTCRKCAVIFIVALDSITHARYVLIKRSMFFEQIVEMCKTDI